MGGGASWPPIAPFCAARHCPRSLGSRSVPLVLSLTGPVPLHWPHTGPSLLPQLSWGALWRMTGRRRSGGSPAVGCGQELQAGEVPADGSMVQGQGPLQGLQGGRVALPKQPLHQQRMPEAGGQVQWGDP